MGSRLRRNRSTHRDYQFIEYVASQYPLYKSATVIVAELRARSALLIACRHLRRVPSSCLHCRIALHKLGYAAFSHSLRRVRMRKSIFVTLTTANCIATGPLGARSNALHQQLSPNNLLSSTVCRSHPTGHLCVDSLLRAAFRLA